IFFIICLKTRKIVHYNVTTNPTRQFLRLQLSEFDYCYPNSHLIHDNSGELKWFPYNWYSIKDIPTVPYSPNLNAYAERFVRSLRQECLDHFIIFTWTQLRRIIKEYIGYYNNYRPHQGLGGIPNTPPDQPATGAIKQKPLLFGLHNHYYREAA
ncbi:MAG: integrase core domain-containing protein, partial [Treponema sp.]|nr:integrase core domain-containing protein [Treponema sp.]